MTHSRYKVYEPNQPYFLTCTVVNWLAIFTCPQAFNILIDSLTYRQTQHQLRIYAYVFLENHLHFVAQAPDIAKEISGFKSYTASQLINYFEENNMQRVLDQFRHYKDEYKVDRQYQVWQEGSHPQLIQGETMLRQKIEYIHNNPVKRGYVDKPEHWRYSSARNYLKMGECLLSVYVDW